VEVGKASESPRDTMSHYVREKGRFMAITITFTAQNADQIYDVNPVHG
jgi:putative lipoic acid-binding regulatory protein